MTMVSSAPDGIPAGAELVPQVGHTAGPTSVAFSPDGGTALSCGHDGIFKLWDIAGGRLLRSIAADKSRVNCVAFSPDGRTALSAGSDPPALKLWMLSTGELLKTFAAGSIFQSSDALAGHTALVNAVAFSANGRFALSGSEDNTVKLWDVASAQVLATFHHDIRFVRCIAWSPDNRMVVSDSGPGDGTLSLWDIASGSLLRAFEVDDAIRAVAFSPDGSALLAAGRSALTLWDVASGKLLRTFWRELFVKFTSVAFLPGGGTVLSAHRGGLTLWDVASAEALRHFDGAFCVAVSPDGLTALSGSAEGALALWNVASGELLKTFGSRSFRSAAVSPGGNSVLTSHDDGALQLWGVMNADLLLSFGAVYPSCLAFSPDGRAVAAVSMEDHCLKLWDVSTGDKSWEAQNEPSSSYSVVFSHDGRSVLCASTSALWLRDAATGQLLRQCSTPDPTKIIAVSPDAASVLSANYDSTIELWDLQSSQLRQSFAGHSIDRQDFVAASPDIAAVLLTQADKPWKSVSEEIKNVFSAHRIPAEDIFPQNDGQMLVFHVDRTVSSWDVASGALRSVQPNMRRVTCGAFSPDARTVLTGSEDGTLRLWDVASGRLLTTFAGHGSVKYATFSPTGRTVLSANLDQTMTLWDTASGRPLQSFAEHGAGVLSIAFSADGHTIRSTTADGMLRLWNAPGGALIATFFTLGHEGAAVFTPDGHFATSADLHRAIAIVCGMDALPMEEFIARHRRRSLTEI